MDVQSTENLAAVDFPMGLFRSTVITTEPLRIKGNIRAIRAVSCLVQLRIGDTVLCAQENQSLAYIMAILDRLEPEKVTLISSEAPLAVQAEEISITSEQIYLISDRVDCNIGVLKRVVQKVDELVDTFKASFGTIFMFAKRSTRRIEELDETRSGHLKLESPTLVEISGAMTAISGEELVKMQSKQIHMG